MINAIKKILPAFLLSLSAMGVAADQNIEIEQQVTLAVDKQLALPDGSALSIVRTGPLSDDGGNLLKGRHQLFFTNKAESTIPVVVNNINVSPGETVEFTVNLSLTSNRLYFPIYPAVAGAAGEIFYDINLPSLSITNCPTEYTELPSNACEKVEVTAGEYVCPDTYTNVGTECSLEKTITINSACPIDFALIGGECVKEDKLTATDSCEPGYRLNGAGLCEQNVLYPMEFTCPDGYALDSNNICKRTYSIEPGETCSSGYLRVGEQCERVLELAVGACEAGFALKSGECFELKVPLDLCPHGYTQVGENCELLEANTPTLDCPAGYALNADNQCVERTEILVSGVACPPDTVNDNGVCKKIDFFEQEAKCGTGQYFDGSKCIEEVIKPIPQCKEGWVLIDGNCYEKHGYELICPDGFTYADDHCERVDIINKQQCPDGFTFNEQEQNCYKTIVGDAIESCPQEYALIDGKCQRESVLDPIGCSSGHVLNDGRCYDIVLVDYVCPNGFTKKAGQCEKVSITEISTRCPDEYKEVNGQCEKLITTDAVQSCATPGYFIENEECLKVTEAAAKQCEAGYTMIDGLCYRTQEPMYFCDDDFVLSEDKATCTKEQVKDAFQTCPETFENVGGVCERRSTVTPELECPIGYEPANGRCEMQVEVVASQCPEGAYYKEDGSCAFVKELVLTCPSNMTLKQGACYERIFKAKDTCKAGFVYSNGECFELLGKEKVCEAGQEAITVGGITLCKSVEIKAFCADGFYFDGNSCINSDGKKQSRQDYCPDGFTYSNQEGVERCTSDENLTLTIASLSCPEGATSVSSSDCLSLCPEGYQDNNGKCESVSLVDFESSICLEGELVDGRCLVSEPRRGGLSGYICPVGTENASPHINDDTKRRGYSKSCLKTITTSKEQVCLSDLGVTGPACVINGTKKFVAAEVCPEGFVVNKKGECAVVEHAENACDGVSFNGPNSSTVDTYVNEKGACVSYVKVEQQEAYVCPTGFKPVYNYDGHALPSELNPQNVVNEAVSSDVWTAFEAQWSTVNFISSTNNDAHQVKGTPKIRDFLCVSDTVTFIEADLGESPEHTFTAIFDGEKNYGIDGQSLVDNVSVMATRYQGNYVSGIDSAGEIYNYEFLKAIVRGSSEASISGYTPSLSINGNSGFTLPAPGTEEIKEFIKLYPVKGHEDKFIIASMLMAGNVEGQSHDAGDYVSRIIQSNKPSMIDIVGGCSVNSEKLVKNIATYNTPLYEFITSAGGFVVDTDSFVSEQNEESCYITYQHQGALTKQCPSGMKMNALGQCETSSGIPKAQSCESISQLSVDYKCPAGTQLGPDGSSCITKTYTPAYSCEVGEYQSDTGLCVRNAECKSGYNVYGEFCGKPIDCNEVLGIEGSKYDPTMNICRSKKYRESGITNTAVPTCDEGEVLDQTNAMCTYPYETATVPATLACSADKIEGEQCVSEVAIPASASQSIELSEFDRSTGQCNTYFVQGHDASEVYCESGREPLYLNGNWYCAEDEPSEPAIPVCPTGYKQSSAGSSNCIKDNITKLQEKPVKGSQFVKGFYVSSIPNADALLCGEDTIWNGSTCEQQVKSTLPPTIGACEGVIEYGFDKNGAKTLICQISTQPAICEAGYTMGERGVCERVEIHKVNNICPNDFTFDGVHCQRLETENVVFSCPDDMTLVSEEEGCKGVVTQPSTVQCPEGESLVNGACINADTDDFVAMCDAPLTYDAINNNCRLEEIEPIAYDCGPNQVLNGYVCEELLVETIIEECPAQFVQNGQCIKTEKVPMIDECPLGYSNQGANCVSSVDNANAIVCPNGSSKITGTSICKKIETTGVIFSCPAPYDLKNGNECQRVVVESSKDQCPSGYRLTENGQCERVTVTQGSMFCASGFTYNEQENRCERLVETSVSSCPENYKLVSGRCYPTYSSKIECPNNFTLNNDGKCVNNAVSPLDTICPNGWRAGGNGQCYKLETTSGAKACPTGYYLKNGVCVEDVFTDINGCPEGFSFVDGQCKETSPVLYSCPTGWNKKGQKCERTLIKPVTSCPNGYTKHGDFCFVTKPAEEKCPNGYINDGAGRCSKLEKRDIASCPNGYVMDGGFCKRVINATQNCPSGYKNDGDGTCSKFDSQYITSCPAGYSKLGNYCYETKDLSTTCPSGYAKQGNTCVKNITKSPSYTCPNNYAVVGDKCSLPIQPYCSEGDFNSSTQRCDKYTTDVLFSFCQTHQGHPYLNEQEGMWVCDGSGSLASVMCSDRSMSSGRCPAGSINTSYNCPTGTTKQGSQCIKSATVTCPSDYSVSNGTCLKTDTKDIVTYCPSGFNKNGTMCVNSSASLNKGYCANGYNLNFSNGKCERTLHKNVNYTCTGGYSLYGVSQCKSNTPTYSIGNCPSGGYTLNSSSGLCERTLAEDVIYFCSSSSYSLYKSVQCKANNVAYSVGSCPSGYVKNNSTGYCDRFERGDASQYCLAGNDIESVNCPTTTCEAGFTLSGGQCIQINEFPISSCDSGYVRINNECFKTQSANPECPLGYTLTNGVCTLKSGDGGVKSCAAGFALVNGSCHELLNKVATCPSQFRMEDGFCKKNNASFPTGCKEGFISDGVNCREVTSSVMLCPEDYVYSENINLCARVEHCHSDDPELQCADTVWLERPNEQCPSGSSLFENVCAKNESDSSGFACPADKTYDSVSGSCINVEVNQPSEVCPSGTISYSATQCYRATNDQSAVICEGKSTFNTSTGECEIETISESTPTCFSGYVPLDSRKCRAINATLNAGICPSGMTLKSDGMCDQVKTSAPVNICPDGVSGSINQCRSSTGSNVGLCPAGFTYENGRCKDTREINNVLSCPDTHFYSNGKCYPMTPKFNSCPSGYSLNGQQCERIGTSTVSTNCRDGFVKSNGMCVKETKRSFVNCQTGFALSNEGPFKTCHKIEESAPTCPENMGLVDGMCKQVVVTDIQNVCFDGYSQLNGSTCFKDLFTPRFFGCPTSHPDPYVPNRTMCTNGTQQIARQPTCAEGAVFDESEGMCRERLTQPILKQCPLEYTLRNGNCVKEVEQHPLSEVKCPTGYVQRIGQSEVCQSLPDYPEKGICPTGTEREGRVCINTETYDPQDSCPAGFAKVGDSCMRTLVSQVDRECLTGNSHDLHYCKNATAVNNLGFGYKYDCPAGYKAKGQSCYRIVTRTIDSVCQSGQVITPEGCRTINEVAHVDTCPSGQQLLSDGVCRSTTPQNGAAECADGYVSTGNGKCYRLDWQSPSVNCSIGEKQGLNCFNFEEIVAEPDCPYGYQFNGSQCQKIEIENIVKVCKSEFGVLNDSFCREIASTNIQANCGANAYFSTDHQRCIERKELPRSTNCPSGMTYNQDTGFCQSVTVVSSDPLNGFVCPAGYWYETERDICVSYQESASKTLFTCPSGYTIHHNECRKTGNVNATYTCPEDTVMVDTVSKMCAYTALDLKLGSCPTGFIYNTTMSICTSSERIKAQASCPSDSLLTSTGQCRRVLDTLPVTKQCTAPFKDVDGYLNCVKEMTAVATPSCPSGFVYHTGISRCVDENIESKIIVCENGYALNAENARCEKLVTKPVDKQCDDRFSLEDGQCISVLPNESVSICDTGFLYDPESDHCVQHQVTEIVYTCPTDYSFDDALKACVRTDHKNAIEDCPTGFLLTEDKKSCVKTKEMAASPACPDNYELNGIECTLVIKEAPATMCPDNFTKRSVNECVSIEEATPISLCGEGYDFADGQCTKTDYKSIERCAAGYRVIDGGCYKTELTTFDCPAGTSLTRNNDDQLVCRFYQTLSNTISCPLGQYSWVKQGCVDVDTDELLTDSVPMCLPVEFGKGELARGEFDKSRNRCIHQKEYPAGEYMNACSGDLIQHDDVYCRAVTADNEKVIPPFGYEYDELTGYVKKELVSSADILCHDGFSLQGDSCKKETVVEPTANTCPEGFSVTGPDTCEISDTMDALFVCPEGYLDVGNNQCQRTIILPAL
ncbi:hypothetical protein [Alteromonas gracilis]|uniref:hypothetical protein n=1 Tax=Alteromonas gracilis TaxID=1479524 RepID=UPI003734D98D